SVFIFVLICFFFFQAEDGIRDRNVTGVQTCALPISAKSESVDEGRSRSGYIIGSSVGSRNKNSSAAIIVMPDATKIHASVCWMMATPVTRRLSTSPTCMQREMSAYFLYIYFSSSSS